MIRWLATRSIMLPAPALGGKNLPWRRLRIDRRARERCFVPDEQFRRLSCENGADHDREQHGQRAHRNERQHFHAPRSLLERAINRRGVNPILSGGLSHGISL